MIGVPIRGDIWIQRDTHRGKMAETEVGAIHLRDTKGFCTLRS